MLEALRIRDFRLLWTGSLISSLGSWLLTIAIPAHVLMVTGSLRDTGLTLAAQYLPMLILGPVAGGGPERINGANLQIASKEYAPTNGNMGDYAPLLVLAPEPGSAMVLMTLSAGVLIRGRRRS